MVHYNSLEDDNIAYYIKETNLHSCGTYVKYDFDHDKLLEYFPIS